MIALSEGRVGSGMAAFLLDFYKNASEHEAGAVPERDTIMVQIPALCIGNVSMRN